MAEKYKSEWETGGDISVVIYVRELESFGYSGVQKVDSP